MVDCAQFLEQYSDFRDGLLPDVVRADFEAHRGTCLPCARYDRVVRQGVDVLRCLPDLEPSCDFLPRLQHRIFHIDDDTERLGRRTSGVSLPVAVAIAAMIAAAAWAPSIRRDTAVVPLQPVLANAPRAADEVPTLFRTGPLVLPEAGIDAGLPSRTPVSNSLFFRYSPLGSNVMQTVQAVYTP